MCVKMLGGPAKWESTRVKNSKSVVIPWQCVTYAVPDATGLLSMQGVGLTLVRAREGVNSFLPPPGNFVI